MESIDTVEVEESIIPSAQRFRDENALQNCGLRGHTVFTVEDDPHMAPGAKSRCCLRTTSIVEAIKGGNVGQRVYQKVRGQVKFIGTIGQI